MQVQRLVLNVFFIVFFSNLKSYTSVISLVYDINVAELSA